VKGAILELVMVAKLTSGHRFVESVGAAVSIGSAEASC
jgi:hypothetical protein